MDLLSGRDRYERHNDLGRTKAYRFQIHLRCNIFRSVQILWNTSAHLPCLVCFNDKVVVPVVLIPEKNIFKGMNVFINIQKRSY